MNLLLLCDHAVGYVTLYLFLMQEKYYRERTQRIFGYFSKVKDDKNMHLFNFVNK